MPRPDTATITYRRVFKGSTPEFTEIKVTDQGKCTFDLRQLDEDADAEPFEVGRTRAPENISSLPPI